MIKFCIATLMSALAVVAKDGSDFNGAEYIALSAKGKSDKIWSKVAESQESGTTHLAQALLVSQAPVFDTPGDEIECGRFGCRVKTIHSIGNVAQIQWLDLGGHSYTGMFKGADYGYVRMSAAVGPTTSNPPNLKPGMGVKLLRDEVDSANFVAMYSVDGQETLNWFAHDWSNHIPVSTDPFLIPGEMRFATQTDFIETVGLSEMASYDQYGVKEDDIMLPWKLRFEPTGEFQFPATVDEGYTDYRTDLASIPMGSTLFNIYAMDKPEELGGKEQRIAQLVTMSAMNPSNFGDNHLYFRHERMENDLAYHPEWEPYTPKWTGVFLDLEQEDDSECPFAKILEYLQ